MSGDGCIDVSSLVFHVVPTAATGTNAWRKAKADRCSKNRIRQFVVPGALYSRLGVSPAGDYSAANGAIAGKRRSRRSRVALDQALVSVVRGAAFGSVRARDGGRSS
jgi:hypothetical protein